MVALNLQEEKEALSDYCKSKEGLYLLHGLETFVSMWKDKSREDLKRFLEAKGWNALATEEGINYILDLKF